MMEKNLEQAAERMKRQHDKHVKPSRQYQPGDRVYLDASKIKTTHASKKLDAKFHGPFKVISTVGKSAYKLELPTGWGIHNVFHESKLKPAHEPQFPKQKKMRLRPPPEIIDGNEEHEVEEVQGVWNKQGKKQFLMKWKGLPQEKRLTRRRADGRPSLHTNSLSQELPAYGENTMHCTPCKGVKNRCTLGNDS
jgi:hypothetical protein